MSNRIRRFREWLLKRKIKKKTAELKTKEKQLKEVVEFIIRQEQPMINTLEGGQKEEEEAKLKQKIQKLTAKNRTQIERLKEELEKMTGKLQIKDGKLVRADESEAPKQQAPPIPSQQEYQQPMPPQQEYQQPMPPQQEYQQPRYQQQEYQQPMYQQQAPGVMEQEVPKMMNQYTQEQYRIPPQEFVRPMNVPPPQIEPDMVSVIITLTEGRELNVDVPAESLQRFFVELNETIENQSTFQIGRQVICGRYIVTYSF